MNRLRFKSVSTYIRSLLLLFMLSQSILLAHEAQHTAQHTDSECQLCIQAQSGSLPGQGKLVLVQHYVSVELFSTNYTNLSASQTPVYTHHNRGPPHV